MLHRIAKTFPLLFRGQRTTPLVRSMTTSQPPALSPRDVPGLKTVKSSSEKDRVLLREVYVSMQESLRDESQFNLVMERLTLANASDEHKQLLRNARMAVVEGGFTFPVLNKESRALTKDELMHKLRQDGGDKILTMKYNVLHIRPARFFKLLEEIKGLTLDEALIQLRFHRDLVGSRYLGLLTESIIKAKEAGFDLAKTYIADTSCKNQDTSYSTILMRDYIRGRGRFGATQNPIHCGVEVVLQEREMPFLAKEVDPLEFLRKKLRLTQKEYSPTAEQVYKSLRAQRPIKPIYC